MKNRPVGAKLFLTDGQMDRQNDKSKSLFALLQMCLDTGLSNVVRIIKDFQYKLDTNYTAGLKIHC
jgi:hypothetical protein